MGICRKQRWPLVSFALCFCFSSVFTPAILVVYCFMTFIHHYCMRQSLVLFCTKFIWWSMLVVLITEFVILSPIWFLFALKKTGIAMLSHPPFWASTALQRSQIKCSHPTFFFPGPKNDWFSSHDKLSYLCCGRNYQPENGCSFTYHVNSKFTCTVFTAFCKIFLKENNVKTAYRLNLQKRKQLFPADKVICIALRITEWSKIILLPSLIVTPQY